MLRVFLTIVLPLLLPTALYLLWVTILGTPQEGGAMSWTAVPWIWLAGAGAVLLAIVLLVVTVHFGSPQQGVYVPPRWEAVRDVMPAFFDLLEQEREPGVHAVLGHWLFGYINPYPDGNGRMARFLMNAMLASGGYPWTVVRVEDRNPYLAALDSASIDSDIAPFAGFIAERVRWSMEQRSAPDRRTSAN